jgi:hypothetical protein
MNDQPKTRSLIHREEASGPQPRLRCITTGASELRPGRHRRINMQGVVRHLPPYFPDRVSRLKTIADLERVIDSNHLDVFMLRCKASRESHITHSVSERCGIKPFGLRLFTHHPRTTQQAKLRLRPSHPRCPAHPPSSRAIRLPNLAHCLCDHYGVP